MKIPHGIKAQKFIDHVNMTTLDEAERCRILLAEVLLRLEKLQYPPIIIEGGNIVNPELAGRTE